MCRMAPCHAHSKTNNRIFHIFNHGWLVLPGSTLIVSSANYVDLISIPLFLFQPGVPMEIVLNK